MLHRSKNVAKENDFLKNRNGTQQGKIRRSFIPGFFASLFAKTERLIRSSRILSMLCGYSELEKKYDSSITAHAKRRLTRSKGGLLKFKIKCAKAAEESLLLDFFDRQFLNFFRTSLRSAGVFFLSAGGVTASATVAQKLENHIAITVSDTLIMAVLFILLSFFFIPRKNKSIASGICDSRMLSYFFCKILSVKHIEPACRIGVRYSSATSLVAGVVFGLISYAVSPIATITAVAVSAYIYLIFTKPENGILLVCLELPLLSEKMLLFLIVCTMASALFKIMRGKRTAKFNLCSGALILFGLIFLSSALFSFDTRGAIAELLHTGLSVGFAVFAIMLIRSSSFAGKCFDMLGLSAIISIIFAVLQTVFGYFGTIEKPDYLEKILCHGISSSFGECELYAAFLIALIPFFAVKQPENSKIFSGFSLAIAVVCLAFANSYYAIVALFFALVISMIIFSKHGVLTAIFATFVTVIAQIFSPKLYGTSIEKFLPRISAPEYGVAFFSGIPEFFSKYFLSGTGIGSDSSANASMHNSNSFFMLSRRSVYVDTSMKIGIPLAIVCALLLAVVFSRILSYAVSKYKSDSAKAKCVAVFCSITALAIFGIFSDYIYDFRISVLFFLLLAFGSSVADSADDDFISDNFIVEAENYRE